MINGILLQDYRPENINNITEEIWCAGAVIPRGKRVIVGPNRNGWQEITFTMGPMQDFIGMALVPPGIIQLENSPARAAPGVGAAYGSQSQMQLGPSSVKVNSGFTSTGVSTGAGNAFVGQIAGLQVQGVFSGQWYNDVQGASAGKPVWVRGQVTRDGDRFYGQVTVTIGQHTNVSLWLDARVMQTVPQATSYAPYGTTVVPQPVRPPPNPPQQGGGGGMPGGFLNDWRTARMTPAVTGSTRSISDFIRPGTRQGVTSWGITPGTRMGPVWPVGSPSMMPGTVVARRAITSWGVHGLQGLRDGLGAINASQFTIKAAEELDEHLTTNGCAGCDDYKSSLRQLAFKFKAACLTDPSVASQVSFNISTPLAMTAYGSGTDKALTLVLGQKRTYEGGPCTDDSGVCLGNLPQIAQVTPVDLGPLIQQVISQTQGKIADFQTQPTAVQAQRQQAVVEALTLAVTGLLAALSAAVSKITPVSITQPAPATPAPAPAEKKGIPWGTVLLGGLIGTAVIGTGVLLYHSARRA
jgi:hypothetical protein